LLTGASHPLQSKGTSHKRLQWTHVLGNAVVKGTFGKHSYDLQVSESRLGESEGYQEISRGWLCAGLNMSTGHDSI
jgi:hypothetical protein